MTHLLCQRVVHTIRRSMEAVLESDGGMLFSESQSAMYLLPSSPGFSTQDRGRPKDPIDLNALTAVNSCKLISGKRASSSDVNRELADGHLGGSEKAQAFHRKDSRPELEHLGGVQSATDLLCNWLVYGYKKSSFSSSTAHRQHLFTPPLSSACFTSRFHHCSPLPSP